MVEDQEQALWFKNHELDTKLQQVGLQLVKSDKDGAGLIQKFDILEQKLKGVHHDRATIVSLSSIHIKLTRASSN